MTDGLYVDTTVNWSSDVSGTTEEPSLGPTIDFTTFSQWIKLQPISTHISLLELIANDLYRRHHGMQAGEIKHVVKDLLALTRHHEKKV